MTNDCLFEMTAQNFRQQNYFGQRAPKKSADENVSINHAVTVKEKSIMQKINNSLKKKGL